MQYYTIRVVRLDSYTLRFQVRRDPYEIYLLFALTGETENLAWRRQHNVNINTEQVRKRGETIAIASQANKRSTTECREHRLDHDR